MRYLNAEILRMGEIVQDQLSDALTALTQHDTRGAEAVVERDDQVDAMNRAFGERCFDLFRQASGVIDERRILGAMRVVTNLERIGDAAAHIAKHSLMLAQEGGGDLSVRIDDMAEIALAGLEECVQSFLESDLELAKRACEREIELDRVYVDRLHEIERQIDGGTAAGHTTLHTLAALKYLEKVCDFVLNIGETTVYTETGSRLTYPQFRQIESLLPNSEEGISVYRHFWDGISGATVIEVGAKGHEERLVFKESYGEKVRDEYERTIEWEGIAPSNTAHVIAMTQARGRTGILREFVDGRMLLDILLSDANVEVKEAAMRKVTEVLLSVWRTTITAHTGQTDYAEQIRSRMRDIFRRHPRLEKVAKENMAGAGIYDLLSHLQKRESWLAPPFSIWTHGDLNANNIVIDPSESVVFIDVHRSRYGDYLQDVAVLATSALRRFPSRRTAKSIARANDVLLEAAEGFAIANGDKHFKLRLRLARARALITSARLEQDEERAEHIFVDGLEMLQKVAKRLKVV
jgi:phosphate transport system regulatory protein PhoU